MKELTGLFWVVREKLANSTLPVHHELDEEGMRNAFPLLADLVISQKIEYLKCLTGNDDEIVVYRLHYKRSSPLDGN